MQLFSTPSKVWLFWEHLGINVRYSIELSTDRSKLIKKMTMSKITRKKLFVDEYRIWNMHEPSPGFSYDMTDLGRRSFLFRYMWYDIYVENLLKITETSRNL